MDLMGLKLTKLWAILGQRQKVHPSLALELFCQSSLDSCSGKKRDRKIEAYSIFLDHKTITQKKMQ